ncbi:MAG: hypothetical protein ABL872_09505 [Lacibacter sp.]
MEKKDINQLKSEIYRQVELIQDETALQMLQEAAEAYANPQQDIVDELTPQQLARLKESIQQADRGETIPDEIVKANVRKWLSK